MSRVTLEGLNKQFGGRGSAKVIDDVTLDIEPGELLVLLGPSGCGKTTTLRCLAGLETADSGRITFGDTTVFDSARDINAPPDQRSIGMVFQSYALWPHMTVRKNIAFPLKQRKKSAEARARWVEETATSVDCADLLDRFPSQLSGGQQQRVALARGLVARPDLVLLDEPLSNLDARLRDLVRAELHELHARLNFTAVLVTHDQSEAFALGDRLAIMRSGAIQQLGTPESVFTTPASEYVARFIGMSNTLALERSGDDWTLGTGRVTVQGRIPEHQGATTVCLRPDDIEIGRAHV